MRRFCLLALLSMPLPAMAALVAEDGWTAGPELGTSWVADDILAIVDDTHFVVQQRGGALFCGAAGEHAVLLGSEDHFGYDPAGVHRLAWRPGASGGLYSLAWGQQLPGQNHVAPALLVVRARCEPDSVESTFELPQGSAGIPPPFDPRWMGSIPTRADGTTYLPTTDGFYTLNLEAPAAPTAWLSREALRTAVLTALPDPFPWTSAAVPEELTVVSGAVTPADELWLMLEQNLEHETVRWLVRVARDGALSVVASPERLRGLGVGAQALVFSTELDALMLSAARRWWLLPLDPSERERIERLPWIASSDDFSVPPLVQAAGGKVALGLQLLSFDPATLDPDRDLLTNAQEATLGLSAFDDDTDGDGISDGTEVIAFESDPKNAASPALESPQPTQFAPSTMLYDWGYMNQRSVENGVESAGFASVICNPLHGSVGVPLSRYDCRWPDGSTVFAEPSASQPWFTPDGKHAVVASDRLYLREVATSVTLPLAESILTVPLPVAHDAVFQFDVSSQKLFRLDGDESFAVIDLGRADCPLLDSEADRVERCQAPNQRFAGANGLTSLGYHAGMKGLVVAVETLRGRELVLATRDRTRKLLHENFFGGHTVGALASLPSGGMAVVLENGPGRAMAVLDKAFRPVSIQPTPLASVGQPFRHGLFSAAGYAYYSLPPETGDSGGCNTSRGITLCAFDPQRAYNLEVTQAVAYREWVPVPEGLERGEGVFWAGGWRRPGGVVITTWAADWALWRVTRLGGAHRWIDAATFTALLDETDRARLDSAPLREVQVTASSAEPWRLCFVEAQANKVGRVWELEFDQEKRTPVGARFVEEGNVLSCGYDQGSLIVMREERSTKSKEAVLDFDDGREVRIPFLNATGFVRLGEHWVILGTGPAACAKASTPEPKVVGNFEIFSATVANGLLHWVQRDGRGFVAGEAAVCGDGGPWESLQHFKPGAEPLPFWTRIARNRYGSNPWEAKVSRATFALRPDGVMLVAPENLTAMQSEVPLKDFYKDMLHRFHPSYAPLNWDHRIEALDPKRRGESGIEAMTIDAESVRAVSVVPWTEAWPDLGWEYLGGEKPPPHTKPVAPQEEPDPELNNLPEGEAGCACGASPLSLLGLLGVLSLRRRRRR